MGFIDKAIGAATGMGGFERAVTELLQEIEQRGDQGVNECTVSLQQSQVGMSTRLDLLIPQVIDRIQDAGHQVIGVETPSAGWSGVVTFRVRPAVRPTPPGQQAQALNERPGLSGAHMTAADLAAAYDEFVRLADQDTAAADAEMWQKRYAIGYDTPHLSQLSQSQQFWIDALPAIAAGYLRQEGRPVADSDFHRFLVKNAKAIIDWQDGSQAQSAVKLQAPTKPIEAENMERIVADMQSAMDRGDYQWLWDTRLNFERLEGRGEASPDLWFWFNAYPAIAAVRLGLTDHRFLPEVSAMAHAVANPADARQQAALVELAATAP